jgi:RHS repeat-associated protein
VQKPILFCVLISILCFAGFAGGQVNPGTPSFSAYDSHQYDTINLQNLDVSLNVPVMSKSGAFPFSAALTGGNSYIYYNGSTLQPGILTVPLSPSINGVLSPFGYAIAYPATTTSVSCPSGDGSGTANKYSGWFIEFPDGTIHNLPVTDVAYGGASCSSTLTDQVIDGTGWTLTINGGTFYSSYQAGVTVVSSGGMLLAGVGNSVYMQDAQSTPNKISYAISQQEWTDTLGTLVLTVDANAAGQLGWFDVNGGNPTESQTFTSSTLKTSFGCSGKSDYPATGGTYLTTAIDFPDSTTVALAWEPNEVTSTDCTGRLGQLTLRSGGAISYNYNPSSGANYGLNCIYTVPNKMTRTTSDGVTTYTWAAVNNGSGNWGNTTTLVDNGGNQTVYAFTGLTATGNAAAPVIQALTQVQHYQGSSTLLTTDVYCYNAASGQPGNCATAVVSAPVTEVDVYHTINGMSNSSRTQTKFDMYGNGTYSAEYDFGASSPTRATTTTYYQAGTSCGALSSGSNINNKPCEVQTSQNGSVVSDAKYTYDKYGNLLTTTLWNGSAWVGQTTANTYNSNGTASTTYDLANNPTTYTYSSGSYTSCGTCTQYPFPTSVSKGGLTTYSTWNGTGGVKLTDKDASLNTTIYGYQNSSGTADPFWRLMSVTDPLSNELWKTYPSGSSPSTVNSSFTFNSGSSIQNTTGTTDGYGRTTNVQTQQSPSVTNYDTATTAYNWSTNYRTVATSQPCSTTSGGTCTDVHTNYYDPLGRLYEKATTSNETVTHTYTENDDLVVLSPAPANENNKQVQKEYDGLGRVTKSCAIGNAASTACGQNTGSAKGVTTSFSYTSATGSTTTTATRGSQSRTNKHDALGRLTQKVTPEGGTWNYYYDVVSGCTGSVPGKLGKMTDPNGNSICYAYDSLGRPTKVNANGTTCRLFYYDNSTGFSGTIPSGITVSNSYGRMAEAATSNCSTTLLTDFWYSYDKDGHQTDMWERTPNSGQYYHSTATFFGNGAPEAIKLASPSEYTSTYGLDGEGRPNKLVTYGETIVSGVTYNAAGQATKVAIGSSSDSDAYTYDSNTGRMTGWTFTVGTKSETGALNWNPNGTLNNLAITDGFNAGGTQTCDFNPSSGTGMGYDDIGRLLNDNCGSIWAQTFSYDQYDNITKSGSLSWNPGYSNSTNQYTLLGTSYDSNGNLTADTFHNYEWNEFSRMKSVDRSGTNCATSGECLVYDAFGRLVEVDSGSTYTEIWYTQLGKTAYMNGSSYKYAYWPTPGGGTLLQQPGNYYFQHKDWLGNARISSGLGTAIIDDRAFAPYGEMYDNFGSTNANELIFTGDTQDVVAGVYNTPNREYHGAGQGRWLSPDPAGAGWNAYAYATNPNSLVDPSGLTDCPQNKTCNGFPDDNWGDYYGAYDFWDGSGRNYSDPLTAEETLYSSSWTMPSLLPTMGSVGTDVGYVGADSSSATDGSNIPIVSSTWAVVALFQEEAPNEEAPGEEAPGEEPLDWEPFPPSPWVYNMGNPGPLDPSVAQNFPGGQYSQMTVGGEGWEFDALYRVYGGASDEDGPWYTPTPQVGGLQSAIDLAVNPNWGAAGTPGGNPYSNGLNMGNVVCVYLQPGTQVFVGPIASQGGAWVGGGGGIQIYVPPHP